MTAPRANPPPAPPPAPRPSQPRDPASTPGSVEPVSSGSDMASAPVATTAVDVPPPAPRRQVRRSRFGGVWIGIIIAAVVLVILLIFILQNTATVTIHFLGYSSGVPIAVALLLAAVCGVLLVAIPGTVRILQLRRTIKKLPGTRPNVDA